jgi:cytochrome c-type biogenesis protein CcsB
MNNYTTILKVAKTAFRLLASLKLAVTLIVLLAAILAAATFVESDQGRDYARWYFYTQTWFVALLGMLGVNILSATLIRFPWKLRQFGFVVTHAGLLVLLTGSILTFNYGVDATISLEEGETSDHVTVRDLNRFSVQWRPTADQPDRPLSLFVFTPGPVDWSDGKSLLLGEINDVKLRVTRYLAHARPSEDWMAAPDGDGIAAMKFSLVGPDNMENAEQWVTASPFGGSAAVGSAKIEFQKAEADTMVDDFISPPAKEDLDPQGLLTIHYEGRVTRVPVSKYVGKKVPLDHSDVSVEIAEYLPNARLQADGRFARLGDKPQNPVVELRVYLPENKEPVRQVARASFANPGGMHIAKCPVKFWYHHPAVAAEPAVEFLATSDGRLYCRVGNGKYESRGEVHTGDTLDAWTDTSVSIVGFVPHARRELVFTPVKVARGDRETFEAAAQVELTAGDTTRSLWLQRGDQGGMPVPVKTSEGTLAISYGYESLPLGFSLQLKKFTRGMNPGGMGDARFASTVHLHDEAKDIDKDQEISMNEPLVHGKYTFYQSGILPSGTGTVLTVACDPGLFMKYLGSIMTCAGTLIMFVMRSNLINVLPFLSSQTTTKTKEQYMRRAIAASLTFLCLAGSAFGASSQEERFDWNAWRSLPVQDGGRQKPLDSLAWETWRLLGNRVSFTDPETNQSLDATAFYLATMLDSATWDKKPAGQVPVVPPSGGPRDDNPAKAGTTSAAGTCSGGTAAEGCDKWDATPLLLVESLEMRKLLGMAADQKYIAPQDLQQAKIESPRSHKPTTFMVWTQQLVFKQENELSPLEKKGVELFNRLRAYQDHRAGRRLEILPMSGSAEKQWIPLDSLLRMKMDDENDPSGAVRELCATFSKLRAAYLAHSPGKFNEASHKFLAMVGEMGPQLGDYPSPRMIDLEVAYNHWAPFRFAWVLMLVAGLCVLLQMGSGWRILYPVGLVSYAAGMVAMLIGFFMRVTISGRAPVTNMYESVVYVGLGVTAIGLILELIYRKRFIAVAAAAVSTVALILADNCPSVLNSSLQPLQPVLRNNFWLVTHVMTITLSYAAFALAMGIANITLGYFLVRSENQPAIEALSRFTYRALQVGVVLLATGTFLGGMWAAYSWGRFWGWDPKEVWALIALLGYLAVLHARFAGWVKHRGLAALATSCFALVIVAWYGVNFVLGAGLHSYGFGGGGKWFMGSLIGAESLYVAAALWRSHKPIAAGKPRLRLANTLDESDDETMASNEAA